MDHQRLIKHALPALKKTNFKPTQRLYFCLICAIFDTFDFFLLCRYILPQQNKLAEFKLFLDMTASLDK